MSYHLIYSSKSDSDSDSDSDSAWSHTINGQANLETQINRVIQKARKRYNYVSSSLENDKLIIKVAKDLFTEAEKIVIQRN